VHQQVGIDARGPVAVHALAQQPRQAVQSPARVRLLRAHLHLDLAREDHGRAAVELERELVGAAAQGHEREPMTPATALVQRALDGRRGDARALIVALAPAGDAQAADHHLDLAVGQALDVVHHAPGLARVLPPDARELVAEVAPAQPPGRAQGALETQPEGQPQRCHPDEITVDPRQGPRQRPCQRL
jgi:hypothetical protein